MTAPALNAADPVDAVVLRHITWDLDHFDPYQVDDRAAEYAALPPSPTAAGLRHLAECRQEQLRLTTRTGGTR